MPIIARRVTPLFEVFDMNRSVAFYCDVLGFDLIQEWKPDGHMEWAMLKLGDAILMLNTCYDRDERPPEPDSRRAIGHADTELYFDCDNVDEAHAHLRAHAVDVEAPQTTHYGMKQVWVTDPDGFKLCFHQPAQP